MKENEVPPDDFSESDIIENTRCIRASISNEVTLVAVSKTRGAESVLAAYRAGQRDFGENKIQELLQKAEVLKDLPDIRWHFIGHIQSNKIKRLLSVPNLYMVHSIDRPKVARIMSRHLAQDGRDLRVLIQVNTSGESSKYGCTPDDAANLVSDVATYSNLTLQGLMTIGKLDGTPKETRLCFSILKRLAEGIGSQSIAGADMRHLSMGMTSDYRVALEEGSTIVRVGQAIFGERALPDSHYWPESK